MAQAKGEVSNANKEIVQSAFTAWRNGTGGPFDLLAQDTTWTIVGHSAASRTYANRAEFLRDVIAPFNARMSVPLKPTLQEIHADGDAVIILFDASGVARNGVPYSNTYSWFFDMRAGKIRSATAFYDSVESNDFWARVTPAFNR